MIQSAFAVLILSQFQTRFRNGQLNTVKKVMNDIWLMTRFSFQIALYLFACKQI